MLVVMRPGDAGPRDRFKWPACVPTIGASTMDDQTTGEIADAARKLERVEDELKMIPEAGSIREDVSEARMQIVEAAMDTILKDVGKSPQCSVCGEGVDTDIMFPEMGQPMHTDCWVEWVDDA